MTHSSSFAADGEIRGPVAATDRVWYCARSVVAFDDAHKDGMDRAAQYKGEAIDELRKAITAYDELIERTAEALGGD